MGILGTAKPYGAEYTGMYVMFAIIVVLSAACVIMSAYHVINFSKKLKSAPVISEAATLRLTSSADPLDSVRPGPNVQCSYVGNEIVHPTKLTTTLKGNVARLLYVNEKGNLVVETYNCVNSSIPTPTDKNKTVL